MKKSILVFCAAVAAVAIPATAMALPMQGWKPANYRVVDSYWTSNTGTVEYERRDRKAGFWWEGEYMRRGDRRCRGTDADRRIKVPSRVRIRSLVDTLIPSLFRGRYVYYRDLGPSRNNDGTGPLQDNHEAWACTAGRSPMYVHVSADGRNALGPMALARLIWSAGSS